MKTLVLTLLLSLAGLVGAAPAQLLSGTVTPPNIGPNGSFTISVSDTYGAGLQLPSSCVISSIHAGGPTGPSIPLGIFCLTVISPIPACGAGTAQQTWGPSFAGTTLVPGEYWIAVSFWDAGFTTLTTEYFCFTLQSAQAPVLSAVTPPTIGTSYVLDINAPMNPGASYFVVGSATTNVGFPAGSPLVCLDQDGFFALTFPTPSPLFFSNFQGTLSALGVGSGISIAIPNAPFLVCQRLNLQGVILDPTLPLVPFLKTNPLSFVIQ